MASLHRHLRDIKGPGEFPSSIHHLAQLICTVDEMVARALHLWDQSHFLEKFQQLLIVCRHLKLCFSSKDVGGNSAAQALQPQRHVLPTEDSPDQHFLQFQNPSGLGTSV